MTARKPLEQKRRAGNPGKRPLPAIKGSVVALNGDVPVSLGADGVSLWRAVTASAAGWLAESDKPILLLACELADRRRSLLEAVDRDGPTFTTQTGYVALNPALAHVAVIEKQMTAMLSKLGLTPADRGALGLAAVKAGATVLEQLLAKRAGRG